MTTKRSPRRQYLSILYCEYFAWECLLLFFFSYVMLYTLQCSVPTNINKLTKYREKKTLFLTNRFVVFVVVSKRDDSFFSSFEINNFFFFLKSVKHNTYIVNECKEKNGLKTKLILNKVKRKRLVVFIITTLTKRSKQF